MRNTTILMMIAVTLGFSGCKSNSGDKAQLTANNQLEEVMGKRTRAIQRQLRSIEALPTKEEPNTLLESFSEEDEA